MSDDSDRFRNRARECRDLAAGTVDGIARQQLLALAKELEEEAHKIEAEQPPNPMPPVS